MVAKVVTSAILARTGTMNAGGQWFITETVFISATHLSHLIFL